MNQNTQSPDLSKLSDSDRNADSRDTNPTAEGQTERTMDQKVSTAIPTNLRSKVVCHTGGVVQESWGAESITLSGVYSADPTSENKWFSDSTPALSLSLTIENPTAKGVIKDGREYYLDIIDAEQEKAQQAIATVSEVTTLTPGHRYVLPNCDNKYRPGQVIQFIEKAKVDRPEAEGGPYLQTVNDGTTNEAVLEMLIDRLTLLNAKFPCRDNSIAITHLEDALLRLNKRTNDRLKRGVEGAPKA